MQTRLDKLLASISPEKTITETYNRANEAINSFRTSARIDKWDNFGHCMARLLQRLDVCILRLSRPVDSSLDYYLSLFPNVLIRVYGPSGEKAAFEMARTGNEGGLYTVLKAVAMRRAECIGDLAGEVEDVFNRQTLLSIQPIAQRLTLDVRHYVEQEPARFS